MCGTSSAGFTQSLGNSGEGHDTLMDIIFPVGNSLAGSLTTHLIFLGGDFFVASFRASQSTQECDVSWRVSIFFRVVGGYS